MAEVFLGEVRIFPFNFAPKFWAACNGQLIGTSQNGALFSLLGTFYGGDGRSTFGLPDLRGRCVIGVGQGTGLSDFQQGGRGGDEMHTLTLAELPSHTHPVTGTSDNATSAQPGGGRLAKAVSAGNAYGPGTSQVAMSTASVGPNAGGLPHNNMQPFLTLNFCIALQGIFPQRH